LAKYRFSSAFITKVLDSLGFAEHLLAKLALTVKVLVLIIIPTLFIIIANGLCGC
jgi:hypothetical protein